MINPDKICVSIQFDQNRMKSKRVNAAMSCMPPFCIFNEVLNISKYHISSFWHKTLQQNPLRKHAYSTILKILPPKNENFQIKILIFFLFSAQNIDCGYSLEPPCWGGSNEYPQSMFRAEIRKNNVYPCKPQFYYIKVGFKEVKII